MIHESSSTFSDDKISSLKEIEIIEKYKNTSNEKIKEYTCQIYLPRQMCIPNAYILKNYLSRGIETRKNSGRFNETFTAFVCSKYCDDKFDRTNFFPCNF